MTTEHRSSIPSPAARREILREMVKSEDVAVLPGVFDGFSGRLVESYGFTAAFVTGSGVAESRFGVPDVGLIGLRESLDGASTINARTGLALIADGDTGYGSSVNAFFTVQAFEHAGLAGILIEDQLWPKRCGHMAGKETISVEDMVNKVRACVEARTDANFIILARTDAVATESLQSAVERGRAYAEAGADLLFADALMSEDDIGTFASSAELPVVVNMGFGIRSRPTTPLLSVQQLKQLGVSVAIYPRMLTASAVHGMKVAMDAFVGGLGGQRVEDRTDLLISFDELNDLVGLPEILKLQARYESL